MVVTLATLTTLIQNNGLALLLPLSVVEGPIVSVVAGWLARLGLLPFGWAYGVLVLGDLIGDALHYAIGRSGARILPVRWRVRFGLEGAGAGQLVRHFGENGGRTLMVAKLTHSLGFAALIAAGAARMPLPAFLWYNLVATLPKSLAFLMLGYGLGHASVLINSWIWRVSLLLLLISAGVAVWFYRRRAPQP